MEIPEAILKRKSVRAFAPKGLTDEEITILIKAATIAPSAGNMQPWGFVIVRDHDVKEALVEASHGQSFIASAPVVMVVCTDAAKTTPRYGERGEKLYCLQDTAAAIENILITATHNGLATCWIGAFDEGMAAETIGLPKGVRPVALIPVGYPTMTHRRDPASHRRSPAHGSLVKPPTLFIAPQTTHRLDIIAAAIQIPRPPSKRRLHKHGDR